MQSSGCSFGARSRPHRGGGDLIVRNQSDRRETSPSHRSSALDFRPFVSFRPLREERAMTARAVSDRNCNENMNQRWVPFEVNGAITEAIRSDQSTLPKSSLTSIAQLSIILLEKFTTKPSPLGEDIRRGSPALRPRAPVSRDEDRQARSKRNSSLTGRPHRLATSSRPSFRSHNPSRVSASR